LAYGRLVGWKVGWLAIGLPSNLPTFLPTYQAYQEVIHNTQGQQGTRAPGQQATGESTDKNKNN